MAVFTTVSKQRLSWSAPAATPNQARFLLIGSGYRLLVGGGNRLIIQNAAGRTPWTNTDKTR